MITPLEIREVREFQSLDEVNACLAEGWLLLSVQARQYTDERGADYRFVCLLGSTDFSADPFGEERREERETRILQQAAEILAARALKQRAAGVQA